MACWEQSTTRTPNLSRQQDKRPRTSASTIFGFERTTFSRWLLLERYDSLYALARSLVSRGCQSRALACSPVSRGRRSRAVAGLARSPVSRGCRSRAVAGLARSPISRARALAGLARSPVSRGRRPRAVAGLACLPVSRARAVAGLARSLARSRSHAHHCTDILRNVVALQASVKERVARCAGNPANSRHRCNGNTETHRNPKRFFFLSLHYNLTSFPGYEP
jgi:hypothetical protein